MSNKNKKLEDSIEHSITKQDVENNPGEGLNEGDVIKIPIEKEEEANTPEDSTDENQNALPPVAEADVPETPDTKNAAGESDVKAKLEKGTENLH